MPPVGHRKFRLRCVPDADAGERRAAHSVHEPGLGLGSPDGRLIGNRYDQAVTMGPVREHVGHDTGGEHGGDR